MDRPVIEFKNFSFQYHAQSGPTLRNINLSVYEGEKIIIIGASGSGKSTLVHCINGLIPFSYTGEIEGSLQICGMETKNASIFQLSKLVGTVLQDTDSQFIGMTVAEDIAFALENDCVEHRELKDRTRHAAQIVNIEDLLSCAPHELSGGQKQRVSLAGVMVDNVPIFLFDEPLANLDPATGKQTIELIEQIKKHTKSTIIIIEHRLEDVLYRDADRIILLEEGRIIADLHPDELLSSNLLTLSGIREPLYITALKYADCRVTSAMHPQHMESIEVDESCIRKVRKWFSGITEQEPILLDEPILTVKNVSFSYTEKETTLHDVSFTVCKGEMLSIVGKNGAGKSTMSKLICGFEKQSRGSIYFGGELFDGYTIKERSRHIGYVMQNPNHMISKSMIFDEVALCLVAQKIPQDQIRERVYKTLQICGLYEFRNWPISALSFGQKKRVTIASVLVQEPDVIILDEPTAGQDFRHYTEIMKFIHGLNQHGVTIIIITHDMHLMLEYTPRSLVFSDGRLIADTTAIDALINEDLIGKANLKKTSLFSLAEKCGIDPENFIRKFIEYDRQARN